MFLVTSKEYGLHLAYFLVIGLSQGGAYFNKRISLASTLNGEEEER